MCNAEKAIEYFYKVMETGNIANDEMQEAYETAIEALGKSVARTMNGTHCPACVAYIIGEQKHCDICGQALKK